MNKKYTENSNNMFTKMTTTYATTTATTSKKGSDITTCNKDYKKSVTTTRSLLLD